MKSPVAALMKFGCAWPPLLNNFLTPATPFFTAFDLPTIDAGHRLSPLRFNYHRYRLDGKSRREKPNESSKIPAKCFDIRSGHWTCGIDGMYSFADLPPGEWTLTAEVEGYPDAAVPPLQVVASKATRHDIVMNVPAAVPPTSPSLAAAPAPAAASLSAATLT